VLPMSPDLSVTYVSRPYLIAAQSAVAADLARRGEKS
jgi:hypothetical protein